MQIKTARRHHLTPVRMTVLKDYRSQVLVRMCRGGDLHALLVGALVGSATVETSMEFPQQSKVETHPCNHAYFGVESPKITKSVSERDICTPMFTAA